MPFFCLSEEYHILMFFVNPENGYGCTEKFMQTPQYFLLHFAHTYTISLRGSHWWGETGGVNVFL